MNQSVNFETKPLIPALQAAKILAWISHKSICKSTAIANLTHALVFQGMRVLIVDTDGVPTIQMFFEQHKEETENRIAKNKAKVNALQAKGRTVSQALLDQIEYDEFAIENRPVVIARSLHELDAQFDVIKREYANFDYIIVDVPAKVLDSKNNPIKEIKRLISFSNLVITPYKGDNQNAVTAVTVSSIIEDLKYDAVSLGGKFTTKVRSLLAFEPARIKANAKEVSANLTLTDTSTSAARLARNAERKALKEIDRNSQMKADIKQFGEVFGEHQMPLDAPLIFRSVYPNQFNRGQSIYNATTESAKLAQAEFNLVVDAILSAFDEEPEAVEASENQTITITN